MCYENNKCIAVQYSYIAFNKHLEYYFIYIFTNLNSVRLIKQFFKKCVLILVFFHFLIVYHTCEKNLLECKQRSLRLNNATSI